MTVELTEFLLARVAEDEAAARAVKPLGHNFNMGGQRQDERFTHGRMGYASEDGYPRRLPDGGEGAHFVRHDPARVLAECEAKRQLVEKVAPLVEQISRYAVDGGSHYLPKSERWPHERMLKVLALPYADHPDFREEWKP